MAATGMLWALWDRGAFQKKRGQLPPEVSLASLSSRHVRPRPTVMFNLTYHVRIGASTYYVSCDHCSHISKAGPCTGARYLRNLRPQGALAAPGAASADLHPRPEAAMSFRSPQVLLSGGRFGCGRDGLTKGLGSRMAGSKILIETCPHKFGKPLARSLPYME